MKRSRFTEDQIIGILKEHEAGFPASICAASTASAMRPSTSGRPSMVVWMSARPSASRGSRTRTPV